MFYTGYDVDQPAEESLTYNNLLRPSPPLRWWSLSLLSYVRMILVIGSGTRASLFTFITYITQYTSHGSRRHISSQDLFRDPPATQMLHNIPHSLINQFPLLASANHRCRASCTPTCSAHLPVLGLYGFLRPTLSGAVNHWHRPSPCICNYVTLTRPSLQRLWLRVWYWDSGSTLPFISVLGLHVSIIFHKNHNTRSNIVVYVIHCLCTLVITAANTF